MKLIKSSLLALSLLASASMTLAGEIKTYDQKTFDALTQAGKPVLLHIHATWCPTCKTQIPIVSDLMGQPAYKDVTTLMIDFDTSKPLLKTYKVTMQSTLIGYKGTKEVARSVGDTSRDGIEKLVKSTVQ
ncbi:thioredoxin family protein [Propionivibrio dicarboxylicus]|uniref:Thiol-disulfide isomerase or thioredoxin n=1 Tax=Propionivibrio dicarboxylicus TaxID=83767 RepID=A0A1G8EWE5_9RHOO|nr:thioredoxin family protein [Propionivibrio dicarboxylicus]SDH74226.1 Thiol-disulfide isomerase or thioredoxin [Propionivibrio dicarboxylicus]